MYISNVVEMADRVAHAVTKMNASVPEANTSKRRCKTESACWSLMVRICGKHTHSICLLASASSGFFATRGRYFTVVRSAHREKISATGLLP